MRSDHLIAILSDTHVGDRARHLEPALFKALSEAHPEAILHAGDVCDPAVIIELEQIAPVHAVMGNRDWLRRHHLPTAIHSEINGVKLTLTHGHISMVHYLYNYLRLFLLNIRASHLHFQKELARLYPTADLIIYGHTHFQVNEIMDGQQFLNPGAAYPQKMNKFTLQYMLLTISADGKIMVEPRFVKPTPDL